MPNRDPQIDRGPAASSPSPNPARDLAATAAGAGLGPGKARVDPEWLTPFAETTPAQVGVSLTPSPSVLRMLDDLARPGAGEPWLVGGCVRDALLGRTPKDIDVVMVGATEESLMKALPLQKVGKGFPVFGYQDPELGRVEIALPRKEVKTGLGHRDFACEVVEGLDQDLVRRDLTVNAVAWNPHQGFRWPTPDAAADFEQKTLRHVSEAFAEDPLRVLRVARFAAQLGPEWCVAPETTDLMAGIAGTLRELPKDRVREEMTKALASEHPSRFFEVLRDAKALDHWFPEVKALIGVDHGIKHHPEGDVWNHMMLVLDRARRPDLDCTKVEMLAALGHDFGKGLVPADRWPKMIDHEALGKEPIKAFCQRLGMGDAMEMAQAAEHHTTLHTLAQLRPGTVLDLALAVRRGKLGAEGFAKVCQADAQGRGGDLAAEPYPQREKFLQAVQALKGLDLSSCGGDPHQVRGLQLQAVKGVLKGVEVAPARRQSFYGQIRAALRDPDLEPINQFMEGEGISWTSGCCGMLAQAIQDVRPESKVVALATASGEASHLMIEYEGRYLDADASRTRKQVFEAYPWSGHTQIIPLEEAQNNLDGWFGPTAGAERGAEFDALLRRVLEKHLGPAPAGE